MIATSPGAPTWRVPSFGKRSMIFNRIDGCHGDDLIQGEAKAKELAHHPSQIRHARRVAGEHMYVGRDGVWRTSLRNGDFCHSVIEAASAVADIEDDATLLGCQRRRQQAAVLNDIGEIA